MNPIKKYLLDRSGGAVVLTDTDCARITDIVLNGQKVLGTAKLHRYNMMLTNFEAIRTIKVPDELLQKEVEYAGKSPMKDDKSYMYEITYSDGKPGGKIYTGNLLFL